MNTEITESKNSGPWVFYDGECRLCIRSIDTVGPLLRHYGFSIAPLQLPWVRRRLGIGTGAPLTEMALLTPEGHRFGGADAILKSAEYIWWARPIAWLVVVLGLRPALRFGYRSIAARRHCWNGACEVATTRGRRREPADPGPVSNARRPVPRGGYAVAAGWLPLALLPVLAISLTANGPRWLVMWAGAFAIWVACKWLTVWQARPVWSRTSAFRVIAYFLAWPGMNAQTFLDSTQEACAKLSPRPLFAAARVLTGVSLIWIATGFAVGTSWLLVGWMGMLGMVLILHFGLFDLLAWIWQRANVAAPRLMNRPTRATSVAEFWGRRWNLAFHELAQAFVFNPVRARFGRAAAVWAVFIVSGLVHELVISVPARGGYGLPTGYFVLQAAALLFERTRTGRRFGLGRGCRGRLFAMVIIALPAFWLFHPQFLQTVILPFMEVIGAL